MATHRSIDSDFWTNPLLRSRPWHLRYLVMGLITQVADDEGRFDAVPEGLLETLFSRSDPVTADDIAADLQALRENETIITYGPADRYGFLVAWYRRQLIRKDFRQPSQRPEPPESDTVPVTSWALLDALVAAKMASGKQSKAWPQVVCREYSALPKKDRMKLRKVAQKNGKEPFSTEENGKEPPDVDVDVDVAVDVEETETPNVKGTAPAAPAPDAASGNVLESPGTSGKPNTTAQAAANAVLAVWGLVHSDLDSKALGRYYPAILKLAGELEDGYAALSAWAAQQNGSKRVLGDGAKFEAVIPASVRKEVTAAGWEKAYKAARSTSGLGYQPLGKQPTTAEEIMGDWGKPHGAR